MKNFLSYIFKSYCWSVIAIILVSMVEIMIIYNSDNNIDKITPFATPFFAALLCGVFYPIYNLIIIFTLYIYKFTKIELFIESICFVHIIDLIRSFVYHNQLWNYKISIRRIIYERVDCYNFTIDIVFGICITILLCLLYIIVKKKVIKQINIRRKSVSQKGRGI